MTRFHTDHYFSIGHAHLGLGSPCQDFALSGNAGDAAFAIIADGCSTGGLTDVGSRIIALSTAQAVKSCLKVIKDWNQIQPMIAIQQQMALANSRQLLGLQYSDMLATCAYAVMSPKGGYVHVQGDGVVAFKYRDGRILMYRYDWADNCPAYLAYAEDNYAGFIAAHGGDLDAQKLTCQFAVLNAAKIIVSGTDENFTLGEGICGNTIPIPDVNADGLEFIAVFSDGVAQIEGQDWKQAVVDLLAFKGIAGEFAKRRMIRHIKDAQKSGKGPIDDIGYSVIRVESEEQHATH